jgi:hypothetical protein
LKNDLGYTGWFQVHTLNNIFYGQSAVEKYSIIQFKDRNFGSKEGLSLTCILKTSLSPAFSSVFIEVFNHSTSTWDVLGENDTAVKNIRFTFLVTILKKDTAKYHDVESWITCRISQRMTADPSDTPEEALNYAISVDLWTQNFFLGDNVFLNRPIGTSYGIVGQGESDGASDGFGIGTGY